MLFKHIAVAAVLASVITGSPVNLEARQSDQLRLALSLLIHLTPPTVVPYLKSSSSAVRDRFPPGIGAIITGSTSFTGPSDTGSFTVINTTGSQELSADETPTVLRNWKGQTFAGVDQVGVDNRFIDTVTC
ncbi:hypothetical protein DFP72DRAFT_1067457 [Ephemerocybe angulata]|uniref:Uncharacterized protein n=1 Tax=Ephemerocybe angulata TaxID=980116 RepID=A0A8H6I0F8_9AGAR|nr:hypothetical protein DFP72DRAFT_1067457 [Tulosesus angulatus]